MASATLNDFIPEGCIDFFEGESFLEAASKSAGLLSSVGAVGEGYADEVIQIIRDRGPYMVVAPQVAIVHGRPSDDSITSAMALVISKKDLISGSEKNDPVRIVFAISSTTNDQHIEMLQALSAFLLISGVVEKLQKSSTVSEVRQILSNNLQ